MLFYLSAALIAAKSFGILNWRWSLILVPAAVDVGLHVAAAARYAIAFARLFFVAARSAQS